MERKGQGAIEYLLIIGAAILVVAIVIVAITSVVTTTPPTGTDANKATNMLKCNSDITSIGASGTGICNKLAANVSNTANSCNCCISTLVTDITKVKLQNGQPGCS